MPKDWTSPQNNSLWQGTYKTFFDPCPCGWRVPSNGTDSQSPWAAFTIDNGESQGSGATAGLLWSSHPVYGGSAWYGLCGWRHFINGLFGNVTVEGTYWSSSAGYLMLYASRLEQNHTSGRAHAFSVRCIRE